MSFIRKVLYRPEETRNQCAETPDYVLDALGDVIPFDFDPCPAQPQFDGLKCEWGQSNYVNPPYNNINDWLEKGYQESLKGRSSVFLLPSRTGSSWFQKWCKPNIDRVVFVKGRIKFKHYDKKAPFDLILYYMPPEVVHETNRL